MAARNPATPYMMGGAANAALTNFTKALADLGAASNVLVTAVSPGPSNAHEQNRNFPLGRIALPAEVADLVCFLASARASFITGIVITLDGGMSRGVFL